MTDAQTGRFWRRVQIADGCWSWAGAYHVSPDGHKVPFFYIGGDATQKQRSARQVMWFIAHGEWPPEPMVCICANFRCVRPDHIGYGIVAKFWQKVRKTPTCWLWEGHRVGEIHEQGAIKTKDGMVMARRFSYEIHKGPIPEGMRIYPSCNVDLCVNPDHLVARQPGRRTLVKDKEFALCAA